MRARTKMLALTTARNDSGSRMEMRRSGSMESDMDMRYGGAESDMEMRRRYRRDSRGRFRSEMEDGGRYERNADREEMRGANYPFPVYEEGGYGMNPIGFDPSREVETNYRMNAAYHAGNEMEQRHGDMMKGRAHTNSSMKLTRELAEKWMRGMKNEDGSMGPHWNMEDCLNVMEQRGIDCDPYEFAAILNAVYSDYSKVLKKHGVESLDLYADLAKAWLKDLDAKENKAFLYYECIVKK